MKLFYFQKINQITVLVKRFSFLSTCITLLCLTHSAIAQPVSDCDKAQLLLDGLEQKITKLHTEDPDQIPLFFYFALDIENELNAFLSDVIPHLRHCQNPQYYEIVTHYDNLAFSVKNLKETLEMLSQKVDSIFHERALTELHFGNIDNVHYFLDRSLQYNYLNPDALLLKCQILFNEERYEECIDLQQVLYYESPIERDHEIAISDFNILFYEHLYNTADSLIKAEKATEALELFKILESFCLNMPSGYCNDDYYHGILRSKKGVYESYLLIARVARDRGNDHISEKFEEYAKEYLGENEEGLENWEMPEKVNQNDFNITASLDPIVSFEIETENVQGVMIEKQPIQEEVVHNEVIPLNKVSQENTNYPIEKQSEEIVITDSAVIELEKKTDTVSLTSPTTSSEDNSEKEREYNRLLIAGFDYCLNDKFEAAYETLKKAMELESCNCFPKDARVEQLFTALAKTLKKR